MADPELLERLKDVDAWNTWREAHPGPVSLSGAKLRDANLTRADFSATDLRNADLTGAICTGGRFTQAVLSCAKLRGADLAKAHCLGADFRGANMGEANLTGTELVYVDLMGATLDGATLEHAGLGLTRFADQRISEALWLETCSHRAPSYLDRSVLRTSPRLPTTFLQGCGLEDWEIEAYQLYHATSEGQRTNIMYRVLELQRGRTPLDFYSVFISHSSENKEFAHKLHDALQERGIRCWLDEKQLLPGDKILDEIDRGIRLWDIVILCCSEPALNRSWWVEDEIDRALEKERERRKQGKRVTALIPLDLDRFVFSWDNALATTIKQRKVADFTAWKPGEDLPQESLERLLRALQTGAAGKEPPPEPKI